MQEDTHTTEGDKSEDGIQTLNQSPTTGSETKRNALPYLIPFALSFSFSWLLMVAAGICLVFTGEVVLGLLLAALGCPVSAWTLNQFSLILSSDTKKKKQGIEGVCLVGWVGLFISVVGGVGFGTAMVVKDALDKYGITISHAQFCWYLGGLVGLLLAFVGIARAFFRK